MEIDNNKQFRLAHEFSIAMAERTIRRLFILLILIVLLWGATIGTFVWYINQYDYESYTYEQDGQGVNIMGDWNGVEYYGSKGDGSPQD